MNKQEIRAELMTSLSLMIENIESMPQEILVQPVNHYDLLSALIAISELFRLEDRDD